MSSNYKADIQIAKQNIEAHRRNAELQRLARAAQRDQEKPGFNLFSFFFKPLSILRKGPKRSSRTKQASNRQPAMHKR